MEHTAVADVNLAGNRPDMWEYRNNSTPTPAVCRYKRDGGVCPVGRALESIDEAKRPAFDGVRGIPLDSVTTAIERIAAAVESKFAG